MSGYPSKSEIKQRLQTTVSRPRKREQGETVYGVKDFNNNLNQGNWASSGKLFGESDIIDRNPRERAEKHFYSDHPLRDSEAHDTVLYKATVAVAGGSGRDTHIISPDEEEEVILTKIEILDRRVPGESVS